MHFPLKKTDNQCIPFLWKGEANRLGSLEQGSDVDHSVVIGKLPHSTVFSALKYPSQDPLANQRISNKINQSEVSLLLPLFSPVSDNMVNYQLLQEVGFFDITSLNNR